MGGGGEEGDRVGGGEEAAAPSSPLLDPPPLLPLASRPPCSSGLLPTPPKFKSYGGLLLDLGGGGEGRRDMDFDSWYTK